MNDLHPLTYENGAHLNTPPLDELTTALTRFARRGCVSVLVYGMPRAGKSTASSVVAERAEGVVVYSTVMKALNGTFSTLVQALQLSRGGRLRFPSVKPETAFVHQVVADCDEVGTKSVWLLIDEAQYLSYEQLVGLKGTHTELAKAKLAPLTVLFAQPEMLAKPQKFKSLGDASLVHRFVSHKFRMRGLRRDEFGTVLKLYDESRWPEDGPTYTEYFAPEHWAKGWRMTNLQPHLEKAFTAVAVAKGRSLDDLPVAYFMEAATSVLQDMDDVQPDKKMLEDLSYQAVLDTGLDDTYNFLGDLETRAQQEPPKGARRKLR